MDHAKVNITPPLELYPHGDEVQTVELWTPPDTWAGLSHHLLNTILSDIDAGLPDGNRYSDGPNVTDRAAWRVVLKHAPDKGEGAARQIIKTWIKNRVLVRDEYENPVTRKPVKGLRVDDAKRPT
jgi:hypothetical protein